jgi:putative RecB family exonuclease
MAVFSHSRLGTFETCPLQYELRYIRKIRTDEEGIEAFLGSRFHEVMEKLYDDLKFRIGSPDELLELYEKNWAREFHDGIVVARADRTADDYRLMGRTFISDYYKSHFPFNQSRVLGLEQKIEIDLDGTGKYRLTGYIDRLARSADGTYEIHDYKTSNALPEQKELDEDRQLALYQIGVQARWLDVERVRLVWHYVAFDRDLTSTRTPTQLAALRADMIRLIDEIEATTVFGPCESALCNWCPYWDYCPAKKHEAKVEALPPAEFSKDDGVALVDAYAAKTAEKKGKQAELDALDEELGAIRGRVIALAEREGFTALKGSVCLLRVKTRESAAPFPKGSKEREALERELRRAGFWDALSTIDPHAFETALSDGTLDAPLMARLEPLIRRERRTILTLSKGREEG